MRFSGKCVVVTGAGSGIGRALAVGFCADGAVVVSIGRNQADLEETARRCAVGQMHFVVGDVGRPEDVERLFSEAAMRGGQVDILVNNAAVYPRVLFLDSTHEAWCRTMQTNLLGLAHCCRLALPPMLERGYGRIINIGSLAWLGPIPKSSGYSVSKGAVRVFSRSLAAEIDRTRYPDVLVNELLPGSIKTGMSEQGEPPENVYQHAQFVASLPAGGPHGRTFLQSALYIEDYGFRARARRFLSKLTFGLVRGERW